MDNLVSRETYGDIEKRQKHGHNRRCINGTITGCGNCVAYCTFSEHPGYLTANLREEHNCIKKKCNYYLQKQKANDKKKSGTNVFPDLSKYFDCLQAFAVIRMSFLKNALHVYYVTISNAYDLDGIAKRIKDETGQNVVLDQLEYDFDICEKLVYKKYSVK